VPSAGTPRDEIVMASESCKKVSSLLVILIAALAIRAAVPLYAGLWNQDSSVFYEIYTFQYVEPARSLLNSGEFASGGVVEVYRPPGYPVVLIPGILLENVVLVTLTIQILLSCLTVLLVFETALLIWGNREAAAMCGAFYAVEPLSIVFSSYLLPETCFTFALSLCLYCFTRYIDSLMLRYLVFSAFALVVAVFVHPLGYFLPPLFAALLIGWGVKRRRSAVIVHAIVFLAVCVSLIGLWQVRNYVRTGYGGFSTLFDRSLYYAQGASVLAVLQGKARFQAMWPEMAQKVSEYGIAHPGLAQQLTYMRDEGLNILGANPLVYAWIQVKGMIATLAGLAAHGYIRVLKLFPGSEKDWDGSIAHEGLLGYLKHEYERGNVAVMLVIGFLGTFMVLVYGLAAVALFSANFLTRMPVIALLSVAFYWLVLTGGPHGYSRYRHAIMPIICLWAGYGLYLVVRRLRHRRGMCMANTEGS
jgi:4-amino-4-deoxy-L-arabinose transferase-like glycosyltransferase